MHTVITRATRHIFDIYQEDFFLCFARHISPHKTPSLSGKTGMAAPSPSGKPSPCTLSPLHHVHP
ncbi:hypothetical protein HanOQP8_Chr03g0109081 [Helianthus annuus]|nr:hypothetical protein HanHA89_Chr03g0108191 [Helianthus annuus]KAJ0774218.1 hypothetical protein HanOQP8_Chr03g0109081 [Helianthus annuus]